MKIAFVDYVCDPEKPGRTGLSDLVWDMASHLAQLGEETHVVAPYASEAVVPAPAVHVHRFRLPPIGYRNIVGHILIILRAYQTLKQIGPVDIIHAPEYVSSAVIASLSRTPLVFTEPGNIYERLQNGNPYDWLTTQVYKLAARITARNCAHCIATSDLMKGWWQWTGVTPDRITLIPLGIDPHLFQPVPGAKEALGVPTDRPSLVYAARLSPENGLDVTLRALPLLKKDYPQVHLHILGDGPKQRSFRQLAEDLGLGGNITWHGWVDLRQLPLYYSAADIFIFSGFSGGTPRVMLQAMACGAPVVASAIGGIVDHIQPRETGLLFAAGHAEVLAAQVKALLCDPSLAHRLGEAGQAYVHSELAWDVLTRRIRAIYTNVKHTDETSAQS